MVINWVEVIRLMNNILCLWSQDFKPLKRDIKQIIVVGCGKFGMKAVERLTVRLQNTQFLVIDSKAEKLEHLSHRFPQVKTVLQDGAEYLLDADINSESWVVPAVPAHLAAEWLIVKAGTSGKFNLSRGKIPEEVVKNVPNPMEGAGGDLYCSFATFFCPDNCSEPEEICTYTKEPRKGNLFEVIARAIPSNCWGVVFRSFQLAPGVGGYPVKSLFKAYDFIENMDIGKSVIIATACRCHGVATLLKIA